MEFIDRFLQKQKEKKYAKLTVTPEEARWYERILRARNKITLEEQAVLDKKASGQALNDGEEAIVQGALDKQHASRLPPFISEAEMEAAFKEDYAMRKAEEQKISARKEEQERIKARLAAEKDLRDIKQDSESQSITTTTHLLMVKILEQKVIQAKRIQSISKSNGWVELRIYCGKDSATPNLTRYVNTEGRIFNLVNNDGVESLVLDTDLESLLDNVSESSQYSPPQTGFWDRM